jgi:hypothetical protein
VNSYPLRSYPGTKKKRKKNAKKLTIKRKEKKEEEVNASFQLTML